MQEISQHIKNLPNFKLRNGDMSKRTLRKEIINKIDYEATQVIEEQLHQTFKDILFSFPTRSTTDNEAISKGTEEITNSNE